ncbi:Cell wall integrity and stress response component 2 [Cyberlindnera fabianii]|uniref:Cell wall integrity and stress response component 2 n=1 Tax=Cyberlindnera fabianii TaxID=36022 RepID=A0A1V2L723_CYBFA|nr:Cell wall integrity and stress response component 2 [Cyberlindnera fabianii]
MLKQVALLSLFWLPLSSADSSTFSTSGCYSLSSLKSYLSSQGSYTFQTNSYCEDLCDNQGFSVAATLDGSTCYCGNKLPSNIDTVDNDKCSSTCNATTTMTATQSSPTSTSTSGAKTSTDTNKNDDDNGSNGLSKGAIAGIAVGAVLGVLALFAIIIFFFLRHRRNNDDDDEDHYSDKHTPPPVHNDFAPSQGATGGYGFNGYGAQDPFQTVPPVPFYATENGRKRLSNGSLPDARHEKTLRVVNPDETMNDTTLHDQSYSDDDDDDNDYNDTPEKYRS